MKTTEWFTITFPLEDEVWAFRTLNRANAVNRNLTTRRAVGVQTEDELDRWAEAGWNVTFNERTD